MKKIEGEGLGAALTEFAKVARRIEEDFKKTLTPFQRNAFIELEKINESLRGETERGCVVIGAAFLDEKLKDLLNKVTAGSNKVKESLFDATGPLGTFSQKIRVAYCFGLISDEAYHDLNVIRDIRNKFAHLSESLSLRDPKWANKFSSLKLPGLVDFSPMPRLAFTSSIGAVAGELNEALEKLKPFTPPTSTFRELVEEIREKQEKKRRKVRQSSD
ncbi:MltR family transcriptional regulator [Burkholderia orbicola]|uniref:MltR family transcriptional regulator n=1 Tax=Burkholderia orbicola TaxID=2978683 RepID=UPI00264C6687|nr:MltR family transcriptional regulator [Burkholderia orbicola]MDN7560329.1 MltR family transcriptional regulator [Burkholderia orbicola]